MEIKDSKWKKSKKIALANKEWDLLSELAKKQWSDEELRRWRSNKTKEQWTGEFRGKRKIAYDKTYYENTVKVLRQVYENNGIISIQEFERLRKESKNNKKRRQQLNGRKKSSAKGHGGIAG